MANIEDRLSMPKILDSFREVFLFRADSYKKWLPQLDKEPPYKLKPIVSKLNEILLWRVEK
jgi:hypothetical protein